MPSLSDQRLQASQANSPAAHFATRGESGREEAGAPANAAVWLTAKRGTFAVGPAPFTPPAENQIAIRNRALAINPVDWMTRSLGEFILPWLKYPAILGTDVAGEVVAVGSAVSRFKVGDRVLGHAVGAEKSRNDPAEGAFQQYTLLLEHMASPIPETMAFEDAAVLPLALSTAACGLFQRDYLALRYPTASAEPTGKTLLVWGGSTSVGGNAIQLAVAAGYDVITTASPRNFEYVKSLGATRAFDYASKTVVGDIVAAFKHRTIAGALAIGVGSVQACLDIVHACEGAKFVAMASPSVSFEGAPIGRGRTLWLIPTLARLLASNASLTIKARTRKIGTKFIWGGALKDNEVSRVIYRDFLPDALGEGRYVAAPPPLVVGKGIDSVPAAMDAHQKGVSARKVVVSL
jgi:NADPH:quinone reductase-like Zn-dependent oxidoreductase